MNTVAKMPRTDAKDRAKANASADTASDERYLVPGLARGLQLLGCFSRSERELTGAELSRRLGAFNAGRGASERIEALLLLAEPPSADAHELSDKGTINQRVTLLRRAADVERLESGQPDPRIVLPS